MHHKVAHSGGHARISLHQHLMGLGASLQRQKKFLGMLGMHGTEANNAMQNCDVLLAVSARLR
jgi:thiamine pyrophosphate-dependent acetolactate synthase large subunit-like protein